MLRTQTNSLNFPHGRQGKSCLQLFAVLWSEARGITPALERGELLHLGWSKATQGSVATASVLPST